MKSAKSGRNATKSTTYALEEKESSCIEPASQEDVEAVETLDLDVIPKDSDNSAYVVDESKDVPETPFAGTASLAVMLGQLVAYFTDRADVDDMDVLSFSLHHLFCRVDFLYCKALPALQAYTGDYKGSIKRSSPHSLLQTHHNPRYRQPIWSELQRINRTLDRMEPLCHLLSDAAECILDAFDSSSATENIDVEESQAPGLSDKRADAGEEQSWLSIVDAERWEQALVALMESLEDWQQSYGSFIPFTTQFAQLGPLLPLVAQIDAAVKTILDCARMIFGDILPSFRAIAVGDEEVVAALLFNLMQQSDQLLVQFDTTLEPLNELIKQFALEARLSDLNHKAAVLTRT